ncbi:MAG: response regulator transcription factor [Bacteroidia bacterium]|nr:response regulator transcription factor [Bacteroidia bacterium]
MQLNTDIKISIVEDNHDIRESLRIVIEGAEGFECKHVFADCESILQTPPPADTDIVLLDIHLPGRTGIECLPELKVLLPKTQFMMFTVFDDDDNIFNALTNGASGYILKRTGPAQILESIKELKNGGSPMSPDIARRVVASFQRPAVSKEAEKLTAREMEILTLLSKGLFYKEIADQLHLAVDTIKKHLHHVYEKLHVQNRTEAINKVFHNRN